jgi:hypothetical protein
MYICKICEASFESIPEGATKLVNGRQGAMLFRFSDGTVHDLRDEARYKKFTHSRWHITPRADCPLCKGISGEIS